MIITKTTPFTSDEIQKLSEEFETYIKTVIDIEGRICSAGMNRHFDGEQLLLQQGSHQSDVWGGGVDVETKEIDFNSFINIRPSDNNTSNEIQDTSIRELYKTITQFFFGTIL